MRISGFETLCDRLQGDVCSRLSTYSACVVAVVDRSPPVGFGAGVPEARYVFDQRYRRVRLRARRNNRRVAPGSWQRAGPCRLLRKPASQYCLAVVESNVSPLDRDRSGCCRRFAAQRSRRPWASSGRASTGSSIGVRPYLSNNPGSPGGKAATIRDLPLPISPICHVLRDAAVVPGAAERARASPRCQVDRRRPPASLPMPDPRARPSIPARSARGMTTSWSRGIAHRRSDARGPPASPQRT